MPVGPYDTWEDCKKSGKSDELCGFLEQQSKGSANSSFSSMSGHACMLKGSTITADFGRDQLFEKGGKKFAKIFLISSAENLKHWQVTPESITNRLRTFIGRPFVSEPALAHFGADDLPVDQILSQQEKYRAGTIRDVVTSSTGEAFAIIEFADNPLGAKVWADMKKGEAIYSSPAVAGFSTMTNGVRLFQDWFGLHLARVASPAYGVFHASLKQTCEGPEKLCMDKLIASASALITDSSQLSADASESKMDTTSKATTQTAMTDEEKKKKLEEEMASMPQLRQELADLKARVADLPGMEGQTTPVTDAVPPNEKQAGQGAHDKVVQYQSQSASDQKIAHLEKVVADFQAKEKAGLIGQLLDMKATAGLVTTANADAERTALNQFSNKELETKIADFQPILDKIMEMQAHGGQLPSEEGRVVHMPTASTASTQGSTKPANLSQLKGKWY